MDLYDRVHQSQSKLGLTTTEESIDNYVENAKDKSVMEVLDHLLSEEVKHQKSRHAETRIRYSGVPFRKTLDQFEFSFQPSIDRKMVDDLMTLRFIHNRENAVFLGPPGVGKTHLSVAIAIQAMQSGIPAYNSSAIKLVQTMRKDWELSRLQYRLATYNRFPLMIVDEIGYLPLGKEEANLFFQFVSSRYEHRSTIYTSNKSFSEWSEILGDHVMASAVLDRVLHHCAVINIRGESYRLKERRKLGNVNLGEVRNE